MPPGDDREHARTRIREAIAGHKICLFIKGTPAMPMCGFSAAVVEVFRELGHPFFAVDVLAEPLVREEIKAHTQWPTLPQVFIDGEFIGGCDIVRELHAGGELARRLGPPPAR